MAGQAGLSTGAPIVQVYHEKSRILPDVSRVLACLYEKGIKFDTRTSSYKSLLKLQASTHAPVPFYDGPTFLEESREICRYISEKYEHHGYRFLLGKDTLERVSVEQWLHNEEHSFNRPSRALFCHLAFPPDNGDNVDDIEMHQRNLAEVLDVYEQRLSDSEFLAGNLFTLADLVHLPNSHYITSSEFVYLYDSRKNVRRWWDAISKRGSWQQVLMYMKEVEEQERKEHQQQKDHPSPRTPGYPLGIYPRKHTTTEPRRVLMHPPGTVSPIAPHTGKPLPIDIPDEPLVSSNQSTTDHKTSIAKSKETPFQEKPPQKSHIPVQSTIAPATSPTTSEKSTIVGAARLSTKDASSPEPTKTDLPTRHKPSMSKDVSNNLHAFDYSKASSHSEEVTAYIESTPQKGSETLDQFSGSSIGHTKTSSIPAKEEPDQHSKSDFYKSDSTSIGVDPQDKDPAPYYERTTQSSRSTDAAASKLHATDADHLRPIQQVKSSRDVQQHPSQDSRQATSRPALQKSMSMELAEGQAKFTQRPYTDHRRDVSSPLPLQTSGARGIALDDKASSDQGSALLSPSTQKHIVPSRKAEDKEPHGTSPPQVGYAGGQDTNKQLRDPGSTARQTAAQSTFGESKAIYSGGSSDALQSPHPRHALDVARHATAPFQKRYPLTEDTTKQTKDIISTPWQMPDQETEDTENTTKEAQNPDSSSSLVAEAPSKKHRTTKGLVLEKETTEDHDGTTSQIHKRQSNIKDTAGQYRDVAFKPKKMISHDDGDALKETKFGDPSLLREQPSDTWQAATTTDDKTNQDGLNMSFPPQSTHTIDPSVTASRTRYPIAKDPSKQPRGTPIPRHKAAQDENDTSEGSTISDKVASSEQPLNDRRAPISPRRQEVEDSPREITSFQRRDPYNEDKQLADTREMINKTQSTAPKTHPIYSQGSIKVEKPPFLHKTPQIIPSGGKGDESTLEHEEVSNTSYNDEKPSAAAPARARSHNGFNVEESHKKGTTDDNKVVSPLRSKEQTSQVQPPSVPSRDADPHEYVSSQQSSIKPWQRASVPLNDMTSSSRDVMDMPTIDQKPTPRSQRGSRSGHGANHMAKEPGEQRVEAPILPIEPETSGAQSTSTFPEVATNDHASVFDGSSQAKVARAERKSTLSDQKPARFAQPLSPVEPVNIDSNDYEADDTMAPQMAFQKQARPSAPIIRGVPTSDRQSVTGKIQEATDSHHTEDSGRPPVPSQKDQISHASQAIYHQEDMKYSPSTRDSPKSDIQPPSAQAHEVAYDQKVVSPLRSKEPTSQVELPSVPSRDADTHGDVSTQQSSIKQWQRASVPLNDMTSSSRDAMDMPTVDQKPTPRSQRGSHSSHGANQMAEEPGEQSVEPPILPIEPETPGVQSTSSFPEIATQDNAFVDDKFAKQSIIDEKLEGPNQMQAPRTDARPASSPTNRKTPRGHKTGDLEHAGSSEGQIPAAAKATLPGPTTTREDSHDATIGEKTAKYGATGDQLVTRSLEEQARPPAQTHEAKDPIGGRRASKEPQLRGNSKAEAARAERKSTLSDQKSARFAQPFSPAEPVNIDSNDYEADDTMVPPMAFQQQARPSAPIIRGVPTSDRQSVTGKIQEATSDSHHTEDSGRPPVPSQKDQTSHVSQAIPPPEYMKYSPSARDSPKSDIQPPLAQVHEVAYDDQKVVSPLRSKEPTSQVQPPSVPSRDADPHGDVSTQQSSIKQWQRASVPLNDMTSSSRDAMDMPTVDQKPTPPRGSHSGHGGNQIDKEGGEQRVEAPILPIEHDISGVQSTSPAFPATTDHAAIDGKFAKQSITDERLGEPKQRQASIADARPASPSTMKYSPSARDSPKSDIQPPSAQVHEVAYDDQKVVSPLRSKEPTSQVQPPSVPSRDADPHGDVSTQQSSIKQWQRASVPLNDMTISSRDAMDMPTINQKRVPPRGSHSGHGGNQIDKEGGEQRVEAPILPIEHDISGVQSTSPAFPATTDHAAIDGKFAKQSITDERLGEPEQTQASIADARPASPSTNRKIPDGVETGGLEQASSSEGQISDTAKATPPGPAIIHEDSHDAAIDKKATKHGSNGDQLITGPLQEHAHPPAPTHGAMEPIGSRRTSKEPQLHGSSQAEVVDAERKSIMSDKKPARAAQPLSPVEPVNIDNNVYGAYDSIAPQMTFRQQARPLAPITKAVPASEFQSVKRKIQEVTPDYHHIEDSGKPLVPSQEDQISHASQAIPPQEDLKYSPSSTDSPKSDIQPPLVQDHEVAHDDQKLVPPLRSKKPTYQGQPPSEPSQDAAPPEDLSNKLSTVEQWQRASVPLANQMAKESGEQRKETPILPIESETSGVQSTSPSFPEAVTTHHAIIDDKFAKQSNIDERLGERKQMQAPITDSPPTSPPIKRKAPDGPETGDLVPAGSSQGQSDAAKVTPPGPATIREDYHDAATDEKTTKYDARGDQLVTGPLHEQARPHAPTHEAKDPIGGRRTSKEPQLRGSSQDEVAHAEQKSILSDQKAARSAQPLSPDMKYSPSARDFPKSDIKPSSAQIHEVSRDESSEQQGSHVESAFRPNELGSTEKKFIPSDEPSSAAPWNEDLVAPIAQQIKALPGVTGQRGTPETREFPTSEDALDDISTNVDVHPTASTKAPRRSFSVEPTSSAQASPFHVAHDSLHTGTTPDDALGNAVSMKPPATPDDQHGITPGNTTDEVAPAEHKFVPSGPDSVHSKRSPLSMVHRNEVTGDSTPETQQIFSMMQRKGDIAAPDQAKGTRKTLDQEDMMSAPLRSVSPSLDTQRPSEKAQEHIPADDVKAVSKPPSDIREVRQSTVVPASAPAAQHGAATDEEVLDKMKFVPSGQDSVRSTLPLSALEQRNGRIGDSSTKPKKGDIASTPDQAKDSEITLRGQDILPPARSVSPSSDIQRPSGKVHDVPTNDLGEAKPIVKASAPDTQYVDAQDEAAPDEKKFAPPEPTSSTEPRKEEIRNSAPSKQLIFSTEKIKENATIGTPDQGKGLQTTLDQQDIPSEPVKLPSPPSDTHHQSKKAREDAPADDLGETTPEPSALDREVRPSTVVPRSAPVTQYGAARDEALDKQKSIPSGQDSVHSALLRNGEIGDPAPSTQQIGDAAASIPKQATDTQITPSRQDILPPVRLESPSSDIQRPLGKVHEDAPADDVREAEPILQASARDTQDKNIVPSEPTSSTKSRNKDIRDSAPSAQVISSTGTTNEDAIIAAPDQDKDLQTTLDQEDILSAPVRSASPSSDTQHPSEKSPEDVLGNDLRETALKPLASGPVRLPGAGPDEIAHDEQKIVPSGQDSVQSVQPSFSSEQIKEDSIVTSADQTEDSQTIMYRRNVTPSVDTSKTPLPGEEQVPLGPDEEHATEPYRTAVDEKITISPSSKAYNSESGSNLTQARTDVHPSIGERPTETSFPGHGLQTQPPLATQDISLGSSNKAKSAGEEAKEPIASAPETQPDSTQPQDEAASAEQNFAISGNQDTRQRPDAREALSKSQESPRDDDGISNLVDPLVRQEQASRAERASEGPVSEMQSANADEKTTLPSSQAQTSNTGPDSTLATGDAYLTSADMPATNSLQNQEAQPLAATQAPITQAPPASSQNVHHADSLENTETPIQPSRAPPAPVTSSAAYSDTLNGEPGTATFQTPQGASFDLLGGEKTTTTQGDQVNPLLNGDLSTSQPVRPSESAGFKGTNTLQKLEGSSANEKSKAQHQTDRSEILSSKDNNKEANEAIRSDLRPKENMKSTREFEHQEQADQAIVQSPDGNRKQIEQTKTHDTETGELEEMDPQENANQTNNKVSPVGALDSSGKQAPGVQLQGENIKYTSNSADNVPGDIQTRSNSEDNLTSYEGAKVQQQPEGNTVDGETGAPLSGTVQQNGRDLPENSYQNNNRQSQAEASDKSAGKFSPGIQNKNKSSSGLDSPTDGTKSGDAEDKSG